MLEALTRVLGVVLRRQARAIDVVGHLSQPGRYAFVLPLMQLATARRFARRIDTAVRGFALTPYPDRRPLSLAFGCAELVSGPSSRVRATETHRSDELMARAVSDLRPFPTRTRRSRPMPLQANSHAEPLEGGRR
jgi:hypothetical protein